MMTEKEQLEAALRNKADIISMHRQQQKLTQAMLDDAQGDYDRLEKRINALQPKPERKKLIPAVVDLSTEAELNSFFRDTREWCYCLFRLKEAIEDVNKAWWPDWSKQSACKWSILINHEEMSFKPLATIDKQGRPDWMYFAYSDLMPRIIDLVGDGDKDLGERRVWCAITGCDKPEGGER